MKVWMIKKFYKVGYIWWSYWSRVYQWIYNRKYRSISLDADLALTDVQHKLASLRWRADEAKELWDACGGPHKVQYILNTMSEGNIQPAGPLDCDDFSSWAANTIKSSFYPRIFTFSWLDEKRSVKGHAMCLLRQKDGKLFHVGNWGTSQPYNNLREACEDILKIKNTNEAVCWGLFDKNLNLLISGPGLPGQKIC